jgi:hypothetical protein
MAALSLFFNNSLCHLLLVFGHVLGPHAPSLVSGKVQLAYFLVELIEGSSEKVKIL